MKFSVAQLRAHERIAFEVGTLENAVQLWCNGNWTWYEMSRQSLINAMREERVDDLTESQLQFVRFIKTHLRPHFEETMSDKEIFLTEPDPDLAEDLVESLWLGR